jgi:hypothetical protein
MAGYKTGLSVVSEQQLCPSHVLQQDSQEHPLSLQRENLVDHRDDVFRFCEFAYLS